MAFDEEICLYGHKYGACYEMFALEEQLLQHPNPTFPPPLKKPSCYEMLASTESALLLELFSLLPSHIHPLVGDNRFANILTKPDEFTPLAKCAPVTNWGGITSDSAKTQTICWEILQCPEENKVKVQGMRSEYYQGFGLKDKSKRFYENRD
ncbi:hypothetical protein BDR07DRAFT_1491900 [Suillus spraguei]|nr:hypothetical protein BDR07DRAFT_1497481 [Suillus spraguei]KAG2356492.1 hypothetical protein BDR07DRAFT_1491900 [Suillus spraguei]